jgi:3-oxoacyl-[acyl-carrier protein] reductase
MKIDLSGKVALVTGGSGELGRVMSRTLAQCGAHVVVHYYQNKEMAEELCQEFKALGLKSMAIQADVTDLQSILKMRDKIQSELGAPDIIVNNAVIQYGPWKEVLEEEIASYESQFRSTVMHNVFMAKAFAPAMIKKKYGRIIGINTECAMQNFPTQSAYVAGKRGMDGVLRVLAKEVGPHQVTVNEVAPGWTISDKNRPKKSLFKSDEGAEYSKQVPLRRRGTDQEVANVVAFLASDLSSFVTGSYISVSGGNVMPAI